MNIFITEKNNNEYSQGGKSSSVSTSAIAAGVDALKENGGRVMLFTCNNCTNGFGANKVEEKDSIKKDKTLINRVNNPLLTSLAESCVRNRTVVDLFILDNLQIDLANLSLLPNFTGGHSNFYESQNKSMNEMKIKFEQIHYDISRIVSRANFYDVKFMLRFSVGVETSDICGPFGKRLGEGFSLASCDPDYAFSYNLRISESLPNNSKINFQFVCLYIDNFNKRYLRIMNYTICATNDISQIYSNADVGTMVKCSIMRDIVSNYQIDVNVLRENITNRISNLLYFYRINVRNFFSFLN